MAELKESNRPGAWLLDIVNTVVGVLNKSIKRPLHRLQYEVLSNRELTALMWELSRLRLDSQEQGRECGTQGWSMVNIGNQVEHLAWIALELDRPEIIIALAWHARQLRSS